jgi:hypothetical protein
MQWSAVARRLLLSAAALGTAGAARAQLPDTAYTKFPRAWVGGLETEGNAEDIVFCLFFSDSGQVRLVRRGHTWARFRWTYDSIIGNLSLIFPHPDSRADSIWKAASGVSIITYDTLTHTAVQGVLVGDHIWFQGWGLLPLGSLDASYYSYARRPCGLPPWQRVRSDVRRR